MKIATILAFALSLSAGQAALACSKHSKQTMSCAEGTVWNVDSHSCQPQTSS
ncbi:hypothetical protein ROA7450_02215 [Roseovarius albus]|uniref:Chitin-binding type-2 domain-containing protein n=1 Tax=Roseovarius albus TaxID=1247867 RepID=A0A1X6ZAK3_9RHOB|nr:chitin-binding domain-containing protein [Roseovarius albus]SLN45688.1 hypothetical protein ROA7450_02215 [Roseovarius albus]